MIHGDLPYWEDQQVQHVGEGSTNLTQPESRTAAWHSKAVIGSFDFMLSRISSRGRLDFRPRDRNSQSHVVQATENLSGCLASLCDSQRDLVQKA